MEIKPVILEGTYVRLEPLSLSHHPGLCKIGLDSGLWELTTTNIKTPEDLKNYMETALQSEKAGTALPFAIVDKATAKPVGSTRYGNIDKDHRRLEIGWTWIGKQWQRTPINTETKLLLLTHAFETLNCIRVEFKTDSLSERSRNALLRIGAKEEGIFRNHMITPSGRLRHTVYYSIIKSEWPRVKSGLQEKLKQ